MNKPLLITTISCIAIICLTSAKVVMQDNGIAGYTGSPGELTCTSCHNTFAVNTGGGSITIATTPSITANQYIPGTTYTVDVTIAKTGISLFGFGTEILNGSNTNAGTISVLNSAQTKLLSSGGKTNIVHQLNGGASSPDSKTFSFKWVAPSTTGSATIYAAGVAANSNASSSSDYVYKTSLVLSAAVGIQEKDVNVHLNIYPNPAKESIHLSYQLKEEMQIECELTTLTGKVIEHYFTEKQNGIQKQVLSVPTTICPGLYLLNLKVNDKNISHRVIIN